MVFLGKTTQNSFALQYTYCEMLYPLADAVSRLRERRIPVREKSHMAVRESNPILTDLPEVAMKCATHRKLPGE